MRVQLRQNFVAPRPTKKLRNGALGVTRGHRRRPEWADSTHSAYHGKAGWRLDDLVAKPPIDTSTPPATDARPGSRRSAALLFLRTHRRVPMIKNASERKVENTFVAFDVGRGFRSNHIPEAADVYRILTSNAARQGQTVFYANRDVFISNRSNASFSASRPNGEQYPVSTDQASRIRLMLSLVSVILPTYNRRQMLAESIDSVFQQTHRPIELIVVDDGSTDGTDAFLKTWAREKAHDDRFFVLYLHQNHAGASAARNFGFKRSGGEYIQYLDSDDLLQADKLAAAIAVMTRDPSVALVCSLMEVVDLEKGTVAVFAGADLGARPTPSEIALRMSQTMLPLFRRRVIEAAGGWDEDLLALQDWEFFARAMLHVDKAVHIPLAQCTMRVHGGERVSRASAKVLEGERSRLRAIRSVMKTVKSSASPEPAAKRRLIWLYAACGLAICQLDSGAGARAALRHDPPQGVQELGLRMIRAGLLGASFLPKTAITKLRSGFRLLRARAKPAGHEREREQQPSV